MNIEERKKTMNGKPESKRENRIRKKCINIDEQRERERCKARGRAGNADSRRR